MNNDSQNFTENVDPLILNKFVELIVSRANVNSNLF